MALGADWVNTARGFMFSLGCIQSLNCHNNTCPTGIATTDKGRQRGLVVSDKAERVYQFHRNTLKALMEVVGAAGCWHDWAADIVARARSMLRASEPPRAMRGGGNL